MIWSRSLPRRAGHHILVAGLGASLMTVLVACSGGTEAPTGDELVNRNEALIAASRANDVETARDLIDAGADVNHKNPTVESAYLISTSEGYLELLELTLENGADVTSLDSFNGTGLIRAAERGHADVVERLLQTEIDVNHVNNLGWTALHEAILLGDGSERYVRTIQLLIDHGADLDLGTGRDGRRPIELAEDMNQPAVVELLRDSS